MSEPDTCGVFDNCAPAKRNRSSKCDSALDPTTHQAAAMDDELATEMRRPQRMRLDEQQSYSPVPFLDKCVCECQGGHSIVAINMQGQVCPTASALLPVNKRRKRRPRYDHTASADCHPALSSFAQPSSNVTSNAQSWTANDAFTGPEVATGQIDGATMLPPLAGPSLFGSMAAPYEIASAAVAAAQMRMSAIHPLPMGFNMGAMAPVPMMPSIMFGHGGFGYSYPSPYTPYCGYETYPFDPRMNAYSGFGMKSQYPASYGSPPAYGACGMQCCAAYGTCAAQPRDGPDADEPKAPTTASTSARSPNTKSATHPLALTVAPDAEEPEPSMSSSTSVATSDTPRSSESSSACSSNEAEAAADRPKANSIHSRAMSPTRPIDLSADARRSTFCPPKGSHEGSPNGSINSMVNWGVCVESIATLSSDEEARDDGMSDEGTDDLASNSCRSYFSSSDEVENEGEDEDENEDENEDEDEDEDEGEGEDEGDQGDEVGRRVGEAVETIGTSSPLDEPISAKASVGHESSTDDEPEDMLTTFGPLTSGYNRYLQLTRSGSRSSRSTVRSETTQESREECFKRYAKTVPEGFCTALNESVYSPPRPSALDSHGFDGDDDSVDD